MTPKKSKKLTKDEQRMLAYLEKQKNPSMPESDEYFMKNNRGQLCVDSNSLSNLTAEQFENHSDVQDENKMGVNSGAKKQILK